MKKIMFNDRYGLTDAVLQGRKNMTRREIVGGVANSMLCNAKFVRYEDGIIAIYSQGKAKTYTNMTPAYKVGEVVAVAQRYLSLNLSTSDVQHERYGQYLAGFKNKMFVRADLMPHQIRITNIRIERLQDISDEDCLREGVVKCVTECHAGCYLMSRCDLCHCGNGKPTPREAFAALIDKVSGKGTWDKNPWVFVYEFELAK